MKENNQWPDSTLTDHMIKILVFRTKVTYYLIKIY